MGNGFAERRILRQRRVCLGGGMSLRQVRILVRMGRVMYLAWGAWLAGEVMCEDDVKSVDVEMVVISGAVQTD